LFQNAVVIPSADTDALAQACSDAGITAVVGVCEKRAGTTGTLFNTQLFIGPGGQLLGKHRKLMPTLAEKVRLASQRGHGVIYFYWEGMWGVHAGAEGPALRQSGFSQLHQQLPR
jgi:aliphatic nitrilase